MKSKRYIDANKIENFEVKCENGKKYVLLPVEHLSDIPTENVVSVTDFEKVKKENKELKEKLAKSVELPCKVGDKVYILGKFLNEEYNIENNEAIIVGKVSSIILYEDIIIECKFSVKRLVGRKIFNFPIKIPTDATDSGKTVFSTRGEAEKALEDQ